jgi:hypothetical protein
VDGERGDVHRSDDAPDRQRGGQLVAPGLDRSLVGEVRHRERRVDKILSREIAPPAAGRGR